VSKKILKWLETEVLSVEFRTDGVYVTLCDQRQVYGKDLSEAYRKTHGE
jgi:hypothetical protein